MRVRLVRLTALGLLVAQNTAGQNRVGQLKTVIHVVSIQ